MHTRRKIRKELSLTVAEYVQNNLMDQLTERVKMRGTNNKKKKKENRKRLFLSNGNSGTYLHQACALDYLLCTTWNVNISLLFHSCSLLHGILRK